MGDAGFFKGASAEQDSRFSDKQKKLLKAMKFPDEFNQKIDMKKVNLLVIRPWVAKRITELLGFEDEVVVEFLNGLLEEPNPDPKMMQINLTGFLEKNTQPFLLELWKLLLSAQESIGGIPTTFVEAKKEEMKKAKIESDRVTAEVLKKRDTEEEEIRKMKQVRKQEIDRRDEGQRSSRRSSRRDTSNSPSSRRRDRSYTPPARRRNRSLTPPRERSRDHYRPSRRYYEDDRSRRGEKDRRYQRDRSRSRSKSRSYTPSRSRSRSRNRKRSRRESDQDKSRGRRARPRSRTRSRSLDKRATNDRNTKKRPRSRSHATSSSSKSALSDAKTTLAVPEPVVEKALTPGFDRALTPSFKTKWDEDEEMENVVESQEGELEDPRELEAKLRLKAMESLKRRK